MFQKEREVYIVWPFWPIIPFSCTNNNNNNNNISITKQITYNLRPIIWPTYKNKKKEIVDLKVNSLGGARFVGSPICLRVKIFLRVIQSHVLLFLLLTFIISRVGVIRGIWLLWIRIKIAGGYCAWLRVCLKSSAPSPVPWSSPHEGIVGFILRPLIEALLSPPLLLFDSLPMVELLEEGRLEGEMDRLEKGGEEEGEWVQGWVIVHCWYLKNSSHYSKRWSHSMESWNLQKKI